EGTPKQKRLIDAILNFPGHLIATMRAKTEWAQEVQQNGKPKPVRVGLGPEQGKGIEYEFDLLMELSADHFATVTKDRSGKYQDEIIEKPGQEMGAALVAWLSEGEPEKPTDEIRRLCVSLGYSDNSLMKWLVTKWSVKSDLTLKAMLESLSEEQISQTIDLFTKKLEEANNGE